MQYYVIIYDDKHGAKWVHDAILPGMYPQRTFDLMECRAVESMGLCEDCTVASCCHVMEMVTDNLSRKLCPVLFHDTVRPSSWKVEQLA